MTEASPWHYREYQPKSDESFIFSTWIDSYRSSQLAQTMRQHAYRNGQRALIRTILARPTARITVACAPDHTAQIVGWICWEHDPRKNAFILHYILTKRRPVNFQRLGIAWGLLKPLLQLSLPIYVSHMTHVADDILQKHPMEKVSALFAYSPYLAFMPEVDI